MKNKIDLIELDLLQLWKCWSMASIDSNTNEP